MRRIDRLLGREEQEPVRYPEDIKALKQVIPELMLLSDSRVEEIYSEYSDMFCAGWLIVDSERIRDFNNWLYERE